MPRDDFPPAVIDKLRKQVAERCSNPDCRAPTSAGTLTHGVSSVGVAAHIHAAAPGGPRYIEMSPAERKGIANGIWLCSNCSRIIDNDTVRFTPELLRTWREGAIETARREIGRPLTETGPSITFSAPAAIARVRNMARALLDAGRRSWKVPAFIAPLSLEVRTQLQDEEPRLTNSTELSSVIEAGDGLVLFGSGGIGKTTFLLDLGATCLQQEQRIPLYLDASVWARSGLSLVQYLVGLPAAEINAVTSADLLQLARAGQLVVMLNGWNEMPASRKPDCVDALTQLIAAANSLGVVVVSRTANDAPRLTNTKQVEVRGLSWEGQTAIVRAELGSEHSDSLLNVLVRNTRLRHAARSPLILRGLISQSRRGAVTEASEFDLLGAAVDAFEDDELRGPILSVSPIEGHQAEYLEVLACRMMELSATNCSQLDAHQAFHCAATRLVERQHLSVLPSLASVLEILVTHHLLHLDGGFVRFAHQRFQEYFATKRLLRVCRGNDQQGQLLPNAINSPFWDDAVSLVCGELRGDESAGSARVAIVTAAMDLDLGLACDLSGQCGFSESDNQALHDQLVTNVGLLTGSEFEEVRDLATTYQIASKLPAFAPKLWPLIENDNQQTRLQTYRLNGVDISISQLGLRATERIQSWSSARRVEFVHETAENVDNYDYLTGLAQSELDPAVREAAISALFWNFPASDVPLQAWLHAPIEVQTRNGMLNHIQYALEEGHVGEAFRQRLRAIAEADVPGDVQLALAMLFPDVTPPRALDVAFERLRNNSGREAEELLRWARSRAPERLLGLARELALQSRSAPKWVNQYLHDTPSEVRWDIFEEAWNGLEELGTRELSDSTLGPLASRNQTERSIEKWLAYGEVARQTRADADFKRLNTISRLLANAPGEDLFDVVIQRGPAAEYDEAAKLVELVLHRIPSDGRADNGINEWKPSGDEVERLLGVFALKTEAADVPQDSVRVYLALIAADIAPDRFSQFLVETCQRHLDAWRIFRERIEIWSGAGNHPRPRNPEGSMYLMSALEKWGLLALPSLLGMMRHPSAMDFVPEAISRVVNRPWAADKNGLFNTVTTDIREGIHRRKSGRALRQPDNVDQLHTDEAANVLGQKLTEIVAFYEAQKLAGEAWNPREAQHRIGRLASIVARIPSANSLQPVLRAIASGLMELYGTVEALRGLVRQGADVDDAVAVSQLEVLYEVESAPDWQDQSKRWVMAGLCELLVCSVPPSRRQQSMDHYLSQWRRFSYGNDVVRELGRSESDIAWPALLQIAREHSENADKDFGEELARALVAVLRPALLPEFLSLIVDHTFFAWCANTYYLGQIAPHISAILEEQPENVERFVAACRSAQLPLADAMAGEVLSHIRSSDDIRQTFLLEAADAGRASQPSMPASHMLMGLFTLKVPTDGGNGSYQVAPRACNHVRRWLYDRAKGDDPVADGSKRLLAIIEGQRREDGRPYDEPRHPAAADGSAWTNVLASP